MGKLLFLNGPIMGELLTEGLNASIDPIPTQEWCETCDQVGKLASVMAAIAKTARINGVGNGPEQVALLALMLDVVGQLRSCISHGPH